jgi:hypothetical protein
MKQLRFLRSLHDVFSPVAWEKGAVYDVVVEDESVFWLATDSGIDKRLEGKIFEVIGDGNAHKDE